MEQHAGCITPHFSYFPAGVRMERAAHTESAAAAHCLPEACIGLLKPPADGVPVTPPERKHLSLSYPILLEGRRLDCNPWRASLCHINLAQDHYIHTLEYQVLVPCPVFCLEAATRTLLSCCRIRPLCRAGWMGRAQGDTRRMQRRAMLMRRKMVRTSLH